ncbi:MAG: PAS domain S-box protein [Candidatus Cloacimonetes bacterium]|nr:PAS domain S-box protein [Candidatus Cloacimonadota bacterium]
MMITGKPEYNQENKMEDQEKKTLLGEIAKLKKKVTELEAVKESFEHQISALSESEEMFRVLSENSLLAMMIYQNDIWVYANTAASQISGFSNQELMGMPFWKFVHPDFVEQVKLIGSKRQKTEETVKSYEFKIITKKGKEKWVWLSGASTLYHGKPAGIVSVQDVSARKSVEQKLRESEERFKFLTQATFEGIVVHKNGIVLDANDAFIKMCGYTRKEAIGKYLLDYIPGMKDRARILINIVKTSTEPYIVQARREDGSMFMAELEAKGVKQMGKSVRIVAVRDVTERLKSEDELRIAHKKLRVMNSILRHDIANDLAVIDSALELYKETSKPGMLDEIEKRVKRCIDTIKKQHKQELNIIKADIIPELVINDLIAEIVQSHPEIKITVSGAKNVAVYADDG